jgi:DNA modification methylase
MSDLAQTDADRDLHVEYLPLDSLKPYKRNARKHTKSQIRNISRSIEQFGFTNPIIIDDNQTILAGAGRFEASKLLGMEKVPTIGIESMTEAQKRAYILADNRLAETAEWDMEFLSQELRYLDELEINFDITLTGFETAEIDNLIYNPNPTEEDPSANGVPGSNPAEPAVSQIGDLWILGPHRLYCGDAAKDESFQYLMGSQRAELIVSDLPYNLKIQGHVSGLGAIQHEEFIMASGEMSESEYTAFLKTAFGYMVKYSLNGSIHFLFMDWRHAFDLLSTGRQVYTELKNLIIWNKMTGGMGSFYRSQHELIFAFKNGTAPHINNFLLGQKGRYRTNVWSHPGSNTFRPGRLEDLRRHPTPKPTSLICDAIIDCSHRGGIVLDPFAGGGTLLIAAERTRRRAFTMDLDPRFVDSAILRWEEYTGESVIHDESGQTFTEIKETRRNEP